MLGDNVHDMLGEKKTIVVLEELVKLPSSQSGRESAVGNRGTLRQCLIHGSD